MKAIACMLVACLAGGLLGCGDDETQVEESTTAEAATYLGAGAIGVTDLDASQEFYTAIFGMALRYALPVPGYVDERILYFKNNNRGSDVVLMSFQDGMPHTYKNNPVRLVFYVPSAKSIIEAIRSRGLTVVTEPTLMPSFNNAVIGYALDPDGYGLEIIESPMLSEPYLGAIGLGVADLGKAHDFYTGVLGMQQMGDMISVPNVWDELIFRYPGGRGSSVVVMHYTDGRMHNYVNNPAKTVHFVADSKALSAKVEQAGLPILSQPSKFTVQGVDALIGLARDPDGYTVEMVTTL